MKSVRIYSDFFSFSNGSWELIKDTNTEDQDRRSMVPAVTKTEDGTTFPALATMSFPAI